MSRDKDRGSSTSRTSYPPCPYLVGSELKIRSRVPTTPAGPRHQGPSKEKRLFYGGRRLEAVILFPAWPPIENASLHSPKECKHVQIKQIIVGDTRLGARIVLCTDTSSDGPSMDLVAKIYDPLYYPNPSKKPRSPFPELFTVSLNINAARDYNSEALAYRQIEQHKNRLKNLVPTYHGSWTFDIDVPPGYGVEPQKRAVCMVLIEHIPGPSILSLTASPDWADQAIPLIQDQYDQNYVTAVWTQLLEAMVRLDAAGVEHRDYDTRNVIITPAPRKSVPLSSQIYPRVVIVDFGSAKINTAWIANLPESPIDRYWTSLSTIFDVIWPEGWENAVERRTWLFRQFGGENVKDFAPLKHARADIDKE